MNKKLLNIELLKPGLVLSTDIYNYNADIILYSKGTVLTEEKIQKLKKFGNISVLVEGEMLSDNSNMQIVQKKLETDIDKIYEYAKEILNLVLNKKDIKEIIKKYDEGIYDHSYKVALLSTIIGLNVEKINEIELEELIITSLLHDIGKSTIDISILNKPGKLTEEEYEIVKTHSKNGYDILKNTGKFSDMVCDGVLFHHENEDGTGYPNNLKKSEIPLFSKVIHVCDVYSALTTKRCYKNAWTYEQAIYELNRTENKFNKELLEILKLLLPFYMKDDVVLLSTDDLATIVNIYKWGMLVKLFGTNECVRIENNNKNSVYIKRKIKTR